MKLTYLGHACIQVDLTTVDGDVRLVIDPGLWSGELPSSADAVLVTHKHGDHLSPASIATLVGSGAAVYADAASLQDIQAADILPAGAQVTAVEPGTTITVKGVTIDVVGGRHAVMHADVPRDANVGFVVHDGDTTFFHPGDTYEYTPQGIDVLGVPLSAPWASVSETIDFVRAVKPAVAVPIHDNLLTDGGRDLYLSMTRGLGGVEVHDIREDGPLTR